MAVQDRAKFRCLMLANVSNSKISHTTCLWLNVFDDVEELIERMPLAKGEPGSWTSATQPPAPAWMGVDDPEAARLEHVVREVA